MVPAAADTFRAAPRFRLVDHVVPPARSPALAAQLGRALRILARQRGGTMLLHACTSGATVRIDCEISGARASVALLTRDEATASAVRAVGEVLVSDAARVGIVVDELSCTGPAARPLLPAA